MKTGAQIKKAELKKLKKGDEVVIKNFFGNHRIEKIAKVTRDEIWIVIEGYSPTEYEKYDRKTGQHVSRSWESDILDIVDDDWRYAVEARKLKKKLNKSFKNLIVQIEDYDNPMTNEDRKAILNFHKSILNKYNKKDKQDDA